MKCGNYSIDGDTPSVYKKYGSCLTDEYSQLNVYDWLATPRSNNINPITRPTRRCREFVGSFAKIQIKKTNDIK